MVDNAWCVDAACSGNPGQMEYRGVDLATGRQVFHFGPIWGTNNIGEFLAIVHAAALMQKKGITDYAIYSDSISALAWVRNKRAKTQLERTEKTEQVHLLIARAEKWLRENSKKMPDIQKWDTKEYGEIPADFGRK
ncbi:MAG: ribonuclease H [Prevotella sp.]|nr:ribonuclease H [Candidatus Equicola stercoris]